MALQGVSYVRDRQEISVRPLEVAAEERGFISPVVGGIVLAAGVVLLFVGRRRNGGPAIPLLLRPPETIHRYPRCFRLGAAARPRHPTPHGIA